MSHTVFRRHRTAKTHGERPCVVTVQTQHEDSVCEFTQGCVMVPGTEKGLGVYLDSNSWMSFPQGSPFAPLSLREESWLGLSGCHCHQRRDKVALEHHYLVLKLKSRQKTSVNFSNIATMVSLIEQVWAYFISLYHLSKNIQNWNHTHWSHQSSLPPTANFQEIQGTKGHGNRRRTQSARSRLQHLIAALLEWHGEDQCVKSFPIHHRPIFL